MKLPGYVIRITLLMVFFAAAGARFNSTRNSSYPYFKGTGAMNYRAVTTVAGKGDLDELTKKANWPEGYRPARAGAAGFVYLVGYSYRVARYLSEAEGRQFCRRFVVLFFSLLVFLVYALTVRLWGSQGAALFAASLVGLFPPLIGVSNGKEFTQMPFALVFAALHLLLLQIYAKKPALKKGVLAAAAAYAVLAVWEAGTYYTVVVVTAALFSPLAPRDKRVLVVLHVAAFFAAAAFIPYLLALRAAFSWQAAFLVAALAYAFVSGRFKNRFRAALALVVFGLVLTAAVTPLRAGAQSDLPGLKYFLYRLRFLFEKPLDPQMLPPAVRVLWSADHANPSGRALLDFFLPILFFVPAVAMAARREWKPDGPGEFRRFSLVAALCAAAAACLMYVIDRSAVGLAAVAVTPLLGLGLKEIGTQKKSRVPLMAVGTVLILLQLFTPRGSSSAVFQPAESNGFARGDKSQFLWVSLENTDRELIKFIASRTSTSDPFLGHPDVTAVLLAFSGRTSVLLPGAYGDVQARKRVETTALLYGGEGPLYDKCRELGVKYVLYSVNFLLDTSRNGPAYLAGVTAVPDECAAVSMHFYPESLTHFNLVYENDHYRLFRVTDGYQPVFTTDHPPVYQREIFDLSGGTYKAFYERVIQVMLAYSSADASVSAGDNESAEAQLRWCLSRAPRFTRARVALASVLIQLGKLEQAREIIFSVMQYAPDNPLALYYAAYSMALLHDAKTAKSYLDILYGLTKDEDLLSRARLLEAFIDQDIPVSADSTKTGR